MRWSLSAPLARATLVGVLAALVIAPPFVARSAQPKLMQVSETSLLISDARSSSVADPQSGSALSAETSGCRPMRKRLWVDREGWIVRRAPTCNEPRPQKRMEAGQRVGLHG